MKDKNALLFEENFIKGYEGDNSYIEENNPQRDGRGLWLAVF